MSEREPVSSEYFSQYREKGKPWHDFQMLGCGAGLDGARKSIALHAHDRAVRDFPYLWPPVEYQVVLRETFETIIEPAEESQQ